MLFQIYNHYSERETHYKNIHETAHQHIYERESYTTTLYLLFHNIYFLFPFQIVINAAHNSSL